MENYKALQEMKDFEALVMKADLSLAPEHRILEEAEERKAKEEANEKVRQDNEMLKNTVNELKKQLTLKDQEMIH